MAATRHRKKTAPPKAPSTPSLSPVAVRFESTSSAITGLCLLYGAGLGLFYLMQLDPLNSFHDSLYSTLWTCVLGFHMGYVVSPTSPFSLRAIRLLTYLDCVLFATLPHLSVCKSGTGRATGAAQGAASILVCCRAFQLLHRIEENDPSWVKNWGRWRRYYAGCGLSWHDLDDTCTKTAPTGHASQLFKELCQYLAVLIIPSYIISTMPVPSSTFSLNMTVRSFAMSGAMVAAFNVFDLAYRLLIGAVHGIAVKSIMADDFWGNKTVAEIWKGWNLPIQRLLASGVYQPLRKRGTPRPLARLCVFAVSGVGHIYPCYCAGLGGVQIGCKLTLVLFCLVVEGSLFVVVSNMCVVADPELLLSLQSCCCFLWCKLCW